MVRRYNGGRTLLWKAHPQQVPRSGKVFGKRSVPQIHVNPSARIILSPSVARLTLNLLFREPWAKNRRRLRRPLTRFRPVEKFIRRAPQHG